MNFMSDDYMSRQLSLRQELLVAAAHQNFETMLDLNGKIEWSPLELADLCMDLGHDYLIEHRYNTKLAVDRWGPDWHKTDHTSDRPAA